MKKIEEIMQIMNKQANVLTFLDALYDNIIKDKNSDQEQKQITAKIGVLATEVQMYLTDKLEQEIRKTNEKNKNQ